MEIRSNPDRLIDLAAVHARDNEALCSAVGTIIALKTIERPSEAMLASVNICLWSLVREIERRLRPTTNQDEQYKPVTWDLLRNSGLLTEPVLVDYALARFAEAQLQRSIERSSSAAQLDQLAVKLLKHADDWVVQAARNFLAAVSKSQAPSIDNLDPQLFHKLCWQIVAAWEILEGQKDPNNANTARNILAQHDEARTLKAAARKLVFFVASDFRDALADPNEAGLHLFFAWLANALDIDHDHVVRLAASNSIAPLATMLRAIEMDQEHAMEVLFLMKGFELKPAEVNMFEESYSRLLPIQALQAVHSWRGERNRSLMGFDRDESALP